MATVTAYASGYANQSGSTWASQTNAQGSGTTTFATWTSSTANATGSIDYNGFGTWPSIPPGSTINNVKVSVKGYCNNATRISTITHRAFIGATGQGSDATTVSKSTSSTNVYADITYTDITLDELQGNTLAIRATILHNSGTQSGIGYWDYFAVTVDYTAPTQTVIACTSTVPSPTYVGSPDANISATTIARSATLPSERVAPENISGLTARWKASTCSAVGNGNAVTDWIDSVSSITATQATTGRKPTYRSAVTSLNSKPALEFVKGSNQNLTAPNGGTGVASFLRGTGQAYTMVVVGRVDTLDSNWFRGVFHVHRTQYAESRIRLLLNTNGESSTQTKIEYDNQAQGIGTGLLSLSNTNYILTVTYDGSSTANAYRDGTSFGQNTSWSNYSADTYKINIATTNDGDSQWSYGGHIAEILAYSTALTATQRAAVHSYLQDEYGITTSDYVSPGPSFAASSTVVATTIASTTSIPTPTITAESASGITTKPIFVSYTEPTAGWQTYTVSLATPSIAVQAGDVVVAVLAGENGTITFATGDVSDGMGGTWAEPFTVQDRPTDFCQVDIYSKTVTNTGSYAITITPTVANGNWGFGVYVFRDAAVGAGQCPQTVPGNTDPSQDITTTGNNSALVWITADWDAEDASDYVVRDIGSSTFTEKAYSRSSTDYAVITGYHDDVGAAGSKTYGWTSVDADPTATPAAVEVKGLSVESLTATAIVGVTAIPQVMPTIFPATIVSTTSIPTPTVTAEGASGITTKPILVNTYTTTATSTADPTTLSNIAVQAGDLILVLASSESGGTYINTNGLTDNSSHSYALSESNHDDGGKGYTAIGRVTSSVTRSDLSISIDWIWIGYRRMTVMIWRNSDGFGTPTMAGTVGANAPDISYTTTQDNSAVVWVGADYGAKSGTPTYRTGFGAAIEAVTRYDGDGARWGQTTVYHADAGAAATSSVGISSGFTDAEWYVSVIEAKGSATESITATTITGVGTVPTPTSISASSEVVVKRWGNILTLAQQDGNDTNEMTSANGSITYETAAPLTGTSSFKVTGNGAGDGVRFVVYPTGYRKACVGGERVTASATVKNLGASKDFAFYVESFTAANGYLYSHSVGGAIPFGAGATATWTGTITTHASAELMGLLVMSAPSTDAFLVDDIYFSRPAVTIPAPILQPYPTTIEAKAGIGTPNTPIKPAIVAVNLIANAEAEINTSGWTSNDGATITRDTTEFHSGVASFKIVAGTGSFAGIQAGTPYIPITPGVTYTLSAWVKGSGAGTWLLWAHLLNYDTSINRQAGSTGITTTSTWTRYSFTFTAEPGVVLLNPIFMLNGTASNGATVYVDDWLLEPFTPTPITNGSVENSPISDVFQYAGGNSVVAQSSTYARSGTYSLRGNITGTNQSLMMEAVKSADAYAVTPGNRYGFSYWIRSDAPRSASAIINWYNASNTWVSQSGGSTRTTSVGDWTLITVSGTAPGTAAKAAYFQVRVDNVASSTEYHYADDFAFFEVTPRTTTQTTIPTPTVTGSLDTTVIASTVQATATFGAAASPWTVTPRYQGQFYDAQTFTTSSFTPSANSLLVFVTGYETAGNGVNPTLDTSIISDSVGLTWTRRGTTGILMGNNDGWQCGGSVFTAPVGANPSAMTITIDPHPGTAYRVYSGIAVVDITGYDTDNPFPQWTTNSIDTVNNSSASLTATFGSTPTLGNLLLLLAYAENDGSAAYSTPTPSGFTQVYNDSATNSHTGIWYRSDSTTTTATISDLGQNIFGGGLFFGEIANKVISGYPAVTTGSTATPTTVAGTTRIFDVQTPTVYTENFEYASSGNITTSNSIFNEVGATAVYAPAPTGRTGNVGALSSATDARLIVQGGAGWPITSGYVKLGSWIYFDDAIGTYEGIIGAQDQQGLYLGAGWGTWGSGTGVRLSSFSTNSYTDYTISLDTWYYFDVEIDIDQRLVIGHIYNSSGTLLTTQTVTWTDVARTNTWGQIDVLKLGRNSAGTTYFDDFTWLKANRPFATVTVPAGDANITATTVIGTASVASPGLATQPQPVTVTAVTAITTPTVLGPLVAHWEASDIAQADGTAVTTWTDRLKGLAPTQGTSGKRPTYRTAVARLNAKPAVQFVRANDNALTVASSALLNNYTEATVVAVVLNATVPNSATGHGIFYRRSSTKYIWWGPSDSRQMNAWDGSADFKSSMNAIWADVSYTFVATFASNDGKHYINGTQNGTGTTWGVGGTTAQISIGNYENGGSGEGFDGWIAEVLVFDKVLSTTDRQSLEAALRTKYDIGSHRVTGTTVTGVTTIPTPGLATQPQPVTIATTATITGHTPAASSTVVATGIATTATATVVSPLAPVYAAKGTNVTGAVANTASIPVPSGMAANEIALVVLYKEDSGTVTAPEGFTQVSKIDSGSQTTHIYWKRATGADSGTYDFSWTNWVWRNAVALRISGVETSGSPFNVINSATAVSNDDPDTSLTTTVDNTLVIHVSTSYAGGGNHIPVAGFTQIATFNDIGISHKIASTAGSAGFTGEINNWPTAGDSPLVSWLGAIRAPGAVANSTLIRTGSTVTATTVAAAAAIPTPTVEAETIQNANITAVVVESVATVPAATPSTGSTVAASEISGVSAIPTVAPSTGSTIAATVVSGIAATPAPGLATRPQPVTVATSATVPVPGLATRPQPVVITAIAAVYGVTPKTGATVTAAVVAGVSTVPAATPSAGISIAAVEVAGSTQVGFIQFSSSVDIQAELILVNSNISAVQPTSSASIVAVEVAGVSTITTPTFSMGATVEAVLVNAVAAVPQPTVQTEGNANISVETIVGAASVESLTVSTGSTISTVTIVGTATVESSTLSTGSTVVSTTISGVTEFYTISVNVGVTIAAIAVDGTTTVFQPASIVPILPSTINVTTAVNPASPVCPAGEWLAVYYDGTSFTGQIYGYQVVGTSFDLTFNSQPPPAAPAVGVDNFCIRFTKTATFVDDQYTFLATSDDGVRVKIDSGPWIINDWTTHPALPYYGVTPVTAGSHVITAEWFQGGGGSRITVSWQQGVVPLPAVRVQGVSAVPSPGVAAQPQAQTIIAFTTVPDVNVYVGVNLSVETILANTAVLDPSVSASGNININAETVVGITTISTPTVPVFASTISAVALVGVVVIPQVAEMIAGLSVIPPPSVSTGSTVTPVTVVGISTVGSSGIGIGITTEIVQAISAVPTPTLSTGETVSASTVSVSSVVGAAVLAAGAGVAPATIVGTTSVNSITIEFGTTVSADTIQATSSISLPNVTTGSDITINAVTIQSITSITGHAVSISYNISAATIVATAAVYAVTISFGAGVIATTIPVTSQFDTIIVHTSSSTIAQTVLSVTNIYETTVSGSSRATPSVILVLTTIPVPYVESGSILTLTDDGSVGVVETVDILVLVQVIDSGSISVSDLALVHLIAAGGVVTTNADDLVLITESNNDLDIYASSTTGENVILHSQAVGTVISSESSTTVFETDS